MRMRRYERLGGVFAIAAVVDHFSDAVVKNPVVGQTSKNPQLREWHTNNLSRLPGLKFMRTLATKPGATLLGLEEAHRGLRISPAEFDEVAAELGRTWTSPRFQRARRTKSWQPSPPTRTRSPPATSPSPAKASRIWEKSRAGSRLGDRREPLA
jgi:truncated hemoglobin YjbI